MTGRQGAEIWSTDLQRATIEVRGWPLSRRLPFTPPPASRLVLRCPLLVWGKLLWVFGKPESQELRLATPHVEQKPRWNALRSVSSRQS